MSSQSIREAGQAYGWEGVSSGLNHLFFGSILVVFTSLIAVFLVMAIVKGIQARKNPKAWGKTLSGREKVIYGGVYVVFLVTAISGLGWSDTTQASRHLLTQWKNEQVLPYLDSLETTRTPVTSVERIEVAAPNYFATHEGEELIPVGIIYVTSSGKSRSLDTQAIIHYDLDKDEAPYMTYKELDESLGRGFNKGPFDVVLHLPKSYVFAQKGP